jgi:hypothetical protein
MSLVHTIISIKLVEVRHILGFHDVSNQIFAFISYFELANLEVDFGVRHLQVFQYSSSRITILISYPKISHDTVGLNTLCTCLRTGACVRHVDFRTNGKCLEGCSAVTRVSL